MKKILSLILIFYSLNNISLVFAVSNFADNSQCTQYEVKDQESFIQILRNHALIPIFGNEGSLKKTYEINKIEKKERKELIHKGDILCLPIRIHFPENAHKQDLINKENDNKDEHIGIKNEDPLVVNLIQNDFKFDNKLNCYNYIIKNGDTIIKILKNYKLRPVFGKSGSLKKTLKINKREGSKGHLIYQGNSLCLPIIIKNDEIVYDSEIEKNEIISSQDSNTVEGKEEENRVIPKIIPIPSTAESENLNTNQKSNTIEDKSNNIKNESNAIDDKSNNNKILSSDKSEKYENKIEEREKFEDKKDVLPQKNESKEELSNKNFDKDTENQSIVQYTKKLKNKKIENKEKIIKTDSTTKAVESIKKQELEKCNKYIADKKEHLIYILRKKNLYPLYGKDGSFQKTVELNKNLNLEDPYIEAETSICLPESISNNTEDKTQILKAQDESKKIEISKSYEENPNLFYTEFGIKYLRLTGTDTSNNTSSTLLSRAILFAEAGFIQKWDQNFSTYFGISYAISQILQSDTKIVIGDSIIRLTNILVGAKYKFYPRFYAALQLSYGDELVYRAMNNTTIQVEKMSSAKMKNTAGYTFLDYNELSFQAELSYLFNTSFNNEIYNSSIGQGFEAALIQSYEGKGWEFRSKIYYLRDYTRVTPVKFDYTEIGLLIQFAGELP
ncbi:LysM peptidoglycan-binding domain-containing protein [Fluviispira multicolorata]|uniref:LysM peptidoglycan-binding domain-containing protein n=1 Tax=Fluviispira multicolorata TaxID=2654512 RepID=A0A833N889_9BACT|nr:LysM peptidoglycan-binding domain-containing protein [Fluviispira multicolorata]KAB8033731.1 LysM peptidoglycan-binding domain-containing protein [Fluviispira multicolorata]